MKNYKPMREVPAPANFKNGDVLVLVGELFNRGYANGLVEAAQACGMKIVYSTVGRRDPDNKLRTLTEDELSSLPQPTINVPLEAGFDLEPSDSGTTPVDQIKNVKMKEWQTATLDWAQVEQSRLKASERFRKNIEAWSEQVSTYIDEGSNVVFAHLMAGGVPRAKIIFPTMNRVFKGRGDRFAASKDFWDSDLGKLCAWNFEDVTAATLGHLIEATADIRSKIEANGGRVSYTAYGYHGTEVMIGNEITWQSYAPYLQGWAKVRLEDTAKEYWQKGVKVSVFNCPEILTNSSSIFQGVEVPLYPLIMALKNQCSENSHVKKLTEACQAKLKEDIRLDDLKNLTDKFLTSDINKQWTDFDNWPLHNGREQMALLLDTSAELIATHKDPKDLITFNLSEEIFVSTGALMLSEAASPQEPVWWLGHDVIAKEICQRTS